MNIKNVASTIFMAVVLCLAGQAQAAPPVLDQQADVADPIPFTFALGGFFNQVLYQSFTVGLGGRLAKIRLPIGCESGEVILEIFDANSDGLPIAGAPARLTRAFDAEMFPAVVSGDFQPLPMGARLRVSPGERLVMVLSNPSGSCGIAFGVAGDHYLGGTGHAEDTVNTFPVPLHFSPTNPDDLPFQTFVQARGPGAR